MTDQRRERTVALSEPLEAITARWEKEADALAARRKEWRAWADGQPLPRCARHATECEVDEEASLRASYRGDLAVVAKACPACKGEEREAAMRARLVRCGVPANLAHASFENWRPATTDDEKALATVRTFAERGRGFLCLMGKDYGIGKSHLAVAVMRERGGGRFITQNQLLLKLRATYRDDKAEDIIEACKHVKTLVIDEIGLSAGGRDELPMLHEILNFRGGAEGLRTVLTSNLEKVEFVAALGERMIDRFRETAHASVALKGRSHRGERRKEYHGAT
jgi:DNA replication protein DnaC